MGNKEKADRQKAASDIVALENALDMYQLDNGRYPSAEQGAGGAGDPAGAGADPEKLS